MSYRVDYKEDWGCIHLIYSGRVDVHEAYASRYKVRDFIVANKCRKVLVDTTQADLALTDREQKLFSQSHHNFLPIGLHIALIVDDKYMLNKDALESPSVAPAVTQRIFSTVLQALDWLLEV